MSSFYLLASCAIMPLCKRGKLVLHNFREAAAAVAATRQQLATLYNDINGFYNGASWPTERRNSSTLKLSFDCK